jgi:hypothetical protein
MPWAWITYDGEECAKKFKTHNADGSEHKQKMNYYACADLPDEIVLAYSVETTNDREKTGIRHEDRKLSTKTQSGKTCSGEVTRWVSKAYDL